MPKRTLSIALLITSFILGSTALADPQAAVNSHAAALLNNEGVKLLQSSKFDEAIEKFTEALKLDPDYKYARANLAITYNNTALKKPPQEAIKLLHRAILLSPDNATTAQNLDAVIGQKEFDPSWADPLIAEAAAKDSSTASMHAELGHAYQIQGNWNRATQEYEQALKIDPDNRVAKFLLANLAAIKGDLTAQKHLTAAEAAAKQKDYKTATSELNEAIKAQPQRVSLLVKLGNLLLDIHDVPGARDAFTRALQIIPGYKAAEEGLSKCTAAEK